MSFIGFLHDLDRISVGSEYHSIGFTMILNVTCNITLTVIFHMTANVGLCMNTNVGLHVITTVGLDMSANVDRDHVEFAVFPRCPVFAGCPVFLEVL